MVLSLVSQDVKKCNRCLEVKPSGHFRRHKSTSDGFESACLDCVKPIPKEKKCLGCGVVFPASAFIKKPNKNSRHLRARCAPCTESQKKSWLSPEKRRKHTIKKAYGLDWESYLSMMTEQNGQCAICSVDFDMSHRPNGGTVPRSACVDHCHSTGKVRGILCSSCNIALGFFRDNVDIMKKAIQYIKDNS